MNLKIIILKMDLLCLRELFTSKEDIAAIQDAGIVRTRINPKSKFLTNDRLSLDQKFKSTIFYLY